MSKKNQPLKYISKDEAKNKKNTNNFMGILFFFLTIIVGILIGSSFIYLTDKQADKKIEQTGIVGTFDPEVFEGWVAAYTNLTRTGLVLYTNRPLNTEENEETNSVYTNRGYPEKFLPELISDFGIATQKNYSGNYIFQAQKENINQLLSHELLEANGALTLFKASTDPINAYDAATIKALQSNVILIEKIQTAVKSINLAGSHDTPIGTYILGNVTEQDLIEPIMYNQVARDYLYNNIVNQVNRYNQYINDENNKEYLNRSQTSQTVSLLYNYNILKQN